MIAILLVIIIAVKHLSVNNARMFSTYYNRTLIQPRGQEEWIGMQQ